MIKEIETSDTFGNLTIHIIIDHGNEQFTSMPKSTYDEMIAAQENQPTIEVTND
jgi:hypothetical protein